MIAHCADALASLPHLLGPPLCTDRSYATGANHAQPSCESFCETERISLVTTHADDRNRTSKLQRKWSAGMRTAVQDEAVNAMVLPLYGIDQLSAYPPDVPVFVVEGETKRDALP